MSQIETKMCERKRLPTTPLISFLNSRGIQVKSTRRKCASDAIIDKLSRFLGDRYEVLSALHDKIKRAMQSGDTIHLNLNDKTPQEINTNCQYCRLLYEIAFLEEYQYYRSPERSIEAKTTTFPKAQRFFSGQWLERYTLQRVEAVRTKIGKKLDSECLVNTHIVLPNDTNFEMDILSRFGSKVYWIEAKSAEYQKYIAKYSNFARLLGLDQEHTFLVLPKANKDLYKTLSSLFSISVCDIRSFEEKFLEIVHKDHLTI